MASVKDRGLRVPCDKELVGSLEVLALLARRLSAGCFDGEGAWSAEVVDW